ncbi:MAG: hypothetical protein E3J40_00305 [Dehalococcoidia bacterium]|nr:MAG: hypothetical protein E3J40_00305 [Dehalococcoidia bacterium]
MQTKKVLEKIKEGTITVLIERPEGCQNVSALLKARDVKWK